MEKNQLEELSIKETKSHFKDIADILPAGFSFNQETLKLQTIQESWANFCIRTNKDFKLPIVGNLPNPSPDLTALITSIMPTNPYRQIG